MTYDLRGFLAFSRLLKVESGKPLKIREFQKAILRDHFGAGRELVVVIPKKNGKTTLLAALALYHLHANPQAEIPVVAASRDQAGVMFRQAEKLVRNSGERVEGHRRPRPGPAQARVPDRRDRRSRSGRATAR